ncbi:MAG: DUF4892 domain-containing protein [bacterium]|nr:DUF4892 domain-containing protein [Gammaproteobacteria bacterium]HIL97182.1 DUF4892 domain-containing protein [Pseudomonadales bacterium]
MAHSRLVYILIFMAPLLVEAAPEEIISMFPGSRTVSEGGDDEIRTYQIITGSIARVNTQMVPKSSEHVQGRKRITTLETPNAQRTEDVAAFYREQLQNKGQIVFECQGRTCGSSNYWANTVFRKSILYGPEQYQHSMLGRISTDGTRFVIVYVAQRGTGKLYTHIEIITVEDSALATDSKVVGSALQLLGKYSFRVDASEEMLTAIIDTINANAYRRLALVAHDNLQSGESVDAGIERTKQVAETLKSRLIEMGMADVDLSAYGAGPIAPIDLTRTSRIELVVIAGSP